MSPFCAIRPDAPLTVSVSETSAGVRYTSGMVYKLAAPLLFAALVLAPGTIVAETDLSIDFERARAGVQRGELAPLASILPRIEAEHGGRAIEVEFEDDDGRPIYEFEILRDDGRVFDVDVDATTGETLEVEEDLD